MKQLIVSLCKIIVTSIILLMIMVTPSLFTYENDVRTIDLTGPYRVISDIIQEIGSEDFLVVQFGQTPRDMKEFIPEYTWASLSYLMTAALSSLILGIALGLFFGVGQTRKGLGILAFLSAIPDFILIMLLEVASVLTFQNFGFRLGYLNYSSKPHGMLILPLVAMIIISVAYVARTVARHTAFIATEDYIQYANAKGLSRPSVIYRHIFIGVVQEFKGDVLKLVSILIGTLFIVERMFSIPGLTRLLFAYGFTLKYNSFYGINSYTVNFRVAFFSIILIATISFLTYLAAYSLLRILERIITHERLSY